MNGSTHLKEGGEVSIFIGTDGHFIQGKKSFPVCNFKSESFQFGLEAEFFLADIKSWKPLWYKDLSFKKLNSMLEKIPFMTDKLTIRSNYNKNLYWKEILNNLENNKKSFELKDLKTSIILSLKNKDDCMINYRRI